MDGLGTRCVVRFVTVLSMISRIASLLAAFILCIACAGPSTTSVDAGRCPPTFAGDPPAVTQLTLIMQPTPISRDNAIDNLNVSVITGVGRSLLRFTEQPERSPGGGWREVRTTVPAYNGEAVFYITWNEEDSMGARTLVRFPRLDQGAQRLFLDGTLRILDASGIEWNAVCTFSDMHGIVMKVTRGYRCSRTDAQLGSVCIVR